jgi:hypothetical protein
MKLMSMKKLLFYSLSVFILISCSKSSVKYLQIGDYDKAIDKSVKVLLKDPSKNEDIQVLSQAYKLGNQKDNEKIAQLKLSGQPDIWDKVLISYTALQQRQEKVARLTQVINLDNIGYKYVNYNEEIANTKNKAVEYYYAHAKSLLDKKDKYSARTAYEELQRLKLLYPNYKDVDDLLKTAYNLGNTYVLFKIENHSRSLLPVDFEDELCNTSVGDLKQKWTIFDSKAVENFYYDYFIIANIKLIDISPEKFNRNNYTESKQIADGWQYKLDANGNVMKDSTGKDIKTPKFRTISCAVAEIQQTKAIVIAGTLDFINNETKQLLKSEPIKAEWFFKNTYVIASGDFAALTPETTEKLNSQKLAFPPNGDMILRAGNVLKDMTKNIIRRNSNLIK